MHIKWKPAAAGIVGDGGIFEHDDRRYHFFAHVFASEIEVGGIIGVYRGSECGGVRPGIDVFELYDSESKAIDAVESFHRAYVGNIVAGAQRWVERDGSYTCYISRTVDYQDHVVIAGVDVDPDGGAWMAKVTHVVDFETVASTPGEWVTSLHDAICLAEVYVREYLAEIDAAEARANDRASIGTMDWRAIQGSGYRLNACTCRHDIQIEATVMPSGDSWVATVTAAQETDGYVDEIVDHACRTHGALNAAIDAAERLVSDMIHDVAADVAAENDDEEDDEIRSVPKATFKVEPWMLVEPKMLAWAESNIRGRIGEADVGNPIVGANVVTYTDGVDVQWHVIANVYNDGMIKLHGLAADVETAEVAAEEALGDALSDALTNYGYSVDTTSDGISIRRDGYEIAWTSEQADGSHSLMAISSVCPTDLADMVAKGLSHHRIDGLVHALLNLDSLSRAAEIVSRWRAA